MSISAVRRGRARLLVFTSEGRGARHIKQRPRLLAAFGLNDDAELLGGHFFGFAFLPHEFQFALGFLEGGRDFLLHAGSGFFEFLR